MRKLALALGLMAGLLLCSTSTTQASGIVFSYDSGSVAAGAAIDSTVVKTATPEAITCYVTNADAGATRAFTVTMYADDGTTVVGTPTAVTIAISSKTPVTIAPDATANGGASAISARPTRRMRFQLAAAGSSAGRVLCIGG